MTEQTNLTRGWHRARYKLFKDQVYESLKIVKSKLHFHLVSADGPVDEVKQRIAREFQYQSSIELQDKTFEMVCCQDRSWIQSLTNSSTAEIPANRWRID